MTDAPMLCPVCHAPMTWGNERRTVVACPNGHRKRVKFDNGWVFVKPETRTGWFAMRCSDELKALIMSRGGSAYVERLVRNDLNSR
jgi:hypothetical protein